MAAQLPPELFKNILHFLLGGSMEIFPEERRRYRQPPALELSKRELCACSLVCRYWAQQLRPKIYSAPILRSRRQALAFIWCVKSTFWSMHSGFLVAEYVEGLRLEQDVHSPSWIHLILHLLPHYLLPNLRRGFYNSIWIAFSTPESSSSSEPGQKRYAPPIDHGLPRRLPLTLSRLYIMSVENTTFCSFKDFISFVSQIPTCQTFCDAVYWLDTETLDIRFPPAILHAKPRQIPSYTMVTDCSAVWPFVWVFTTCRLSSNWSLPHQPAIYVVPSQLANVTALVKCLFDDCTCLGCSSKKSTKTGEGTGGKIVFSVPNIVSGVPTANRRLTIRHQSLSHHSLTITLSLQGFVTALQLDLSGEIYIHDSVSSPRTLNIDWNTIDHLASQFTTRTQDLWPLVIDVDACSMDDMLAFAPYVRSNMPLMQTAGRLVLKFPQSAYRQSGIPWIT